MESKGFTIIEFIGIMVAIGILAAVVSTSWPTKTNLLILNSQAAALINDIRYAQQLSMTRGERYRFVKISAKAYQVMNSSGTPIVMPTGDNTIQLKAGVTFGNLTNLPNNLIAFNCQGIPYIDTSTPGTPLSNTATISLRTNGIARIISISPETGRITL